MYAHAALMGGAKIICTYQRAFVTGKAYALISEYALMCDMRLKTREYGIEKEASLTELGSWFYFSVPGTPLNISPYPYAVSDFLSDIHFT